MPSANINTLAGRAHSELFGKGSSRRDIISDIRDKEDCRGWLHQGNAAGANFYISTCTIPFVLTMISSWFFVSPLGKLRNSQTLSLSRQVTVSSTFVDCSA